MDCVKDDMRIKVVGMEMTSNSRKWEKKTYCADLTCGIGDDDDDEYM
jgi:hypothetical protein